MRLPLSSRWTLVAAVGLAAACGSYEGAVVIVTPVDGDVLTGLTSVRLIATSSVRVRGVEIEVDGRRAHTDLDLPYTGELDTAELTDGLHEVGVVSVTAESAHRDAVVVAVDNEPPTVELLSPRDGDRLTSGEPLAVEIAVDEPAGDVAVVVQVDGQKVAALDRPPYRLTLPDDTLPALLSAQRTVLVAVTSPGGHRVWTSAVIEVTP